mgnify:FL=1|jgi:hypothetical protein|tara:strand:- start:5 stop:469 length:465 start_codon:yes stop_codon:yes gene_type:complete
MSDLKNIRPFKVPHNYFNDFDKKLKGKIDLENHQSDFKVPENYFSKVEAEIVSKINFYKTKTVPLFRYILLVAAAILSFIFITFDTSAEDNTETTVLILEDYLMENSTYEIADHNADYLSFEMINMDQSINYEDALELRLLSETPMNLNLFDDE